VTEKGYENPMFVEDVVREIAKRLKRDKSITWFTVELKTSSRFIITALMPLWKEEKTINIQSP